MNHQDTHKNQLSGSKRAMRPQDNRRTVTLIYINMPAWLSHCRQGAAL